MKTSTSTLALAVLLGGACACACAAADDTQRLIPWPSLGGKPHPDEAALATADWTTLARQSLAPRAVQSLNRDRTFNYFPAEQLDPAPVAPEGTAALGGLTWDRPRGGEVLWQIGTPDRSAAEFGFAE
ncbi:hypothetical protein, partial [Gemmata sp.]|uniref:hypothetical protein n=1 Tax=Gemmata sp. TaxID=1914242 RepID=UPI003F7031E2